MGWLNNLADQIFFPLDHVAWAIDSGLISGSSGGGGNPWGDGATYFWAASLLCNIAKAARCLVILKEDEEGRAAGAKDADQKR